MSLTPLTQAPETKENGYILLLAVLVSSIILGISFGVYSISIKEIILASYLKDSARAFATADRAIECTLYWDRSFPQNGMPYTIYATSTAYIAPWVLDPVLHDPLTVLCDAQQIILPTPANTNWDVPAASLTATAGITTFSLVFPDGTCADVEVEKDEDNGSIFTANGYNTCDTANPRRINRTIQVTSNI